MLFMEAAVWSAAVDHANSNDHHLQARVLGGSTHLQTTHQQTEAHVIKREQDQQTRVTLGPVFCTNSSDNATPAGAI